MSVLTLTGNYVRVISECVTLTVLMGLFVFCPWNEHGTETPTPSVRRCTRGQSSVHDTVHKVYVIEQNKSAIRILYL